MGEKAVRFSDLSGQMIQNPEDLAQITVTDHPNLEAPVRIDALPDELAQLGKFSLAAVTLEETMPGEEEPTRATFSPRPTSASWRRTGRWTKCSQALNQLPPSVDRATGKRATTKLSNGQVPHT